MSDLFMLICLIGVLMMQCCLLVSQASLYSQMKRKIENTGHFLAKKEKPPDCSYASAHKRTLERWKRGVNQ